MKKELGLGLYSLAGVYGKKDLDEIKKLLIYAAEHSIEYFDVADQYGPAEEVLGTTLKPYRARIKIATKVGVTGEGGFNLSYDYIQKACRQSLKKLQTDYIDLYQVHFDDHKTPVPETVGALEELKKDGLILNYGLGHLPIERLREYTGIGNPFSLMLELSPVAVKKYNEFLPVCEERGLKIITMGTTGRGILTGKFKPGHVFETGDIRNMDPLYQRSLYQSALRVLDKLTELAAQLDKSPVQIAIAWVLGLAHVAITLVGPSKITHLQENMGGAGWGLPAAVRSELDAFLAREEKWKREAWYNDLQQILQSPLSQEKNIVVADLVYVLEGLVELEKAEAHHVMPLFGKLMAWYRGKETDAAAQEIQAKLHDMFFLLTYTTR